MTGWAPMETDDELIDRMAADVIEGCERRLAAEAEMDGHDGA